MPGDRPAGVLTTGQLQNLVHLHHAEVGRRAVIVGAELVSWSAVLTLRAAGARTVLMTTTHPSPESYGAFNLAGRSGCGFRWPPARKVTRIIGKGRVRAVEMEDLSTGRRREIDCDTVIFTGDWIPDHELARAGACRSTAGHAVRWSILPNEPRRRVCSPSETSSIPSTPRTSPHWTEQRSSTQCSTTSVRRDGTRRPVCACESNFPCGGSARGSCGPTGRPRPRGRYLLWTEELVRLPHIWIRQDDKVLARKTLAWPASPGRVFRLPSALLYRRRSGGRRRHDQPAVRTRPISSREPRWCSSTGSSVRREAGERAVTGMRSVCHGFAGQR